MSFTYIRDLDDQRLEPLAQCSSRTLYIISLTGYNYIGRI